MSMKGKISNAVESFGLRITSYNEGRGLYFIGDRSGTYVGTVRTRREGRHERVFAFVRDRENKRKVYPNLNEAILNIS